MWLDELEDEIKYWHDPENYIMPVDIDVVRRLVAIARKAEWSGEGLLRGKYVDACPFCNLRKPLSENHLRRCLYDWSPE